MLEISHLMYQPIVDSKFRTIGHECLVRFPSTSRPIDYIINTMSIESQHTFSENLINRLISSSLTEHVAEKLRKKSLFVNFEKNNLAQDKVIDKIIILSSTLAAYDIPLIVEITERALDENIPLAVYLRGLKRIKSSEIKIALDDFPFFSCSGIELELGLCDIVKIEISHLLNEDFPLNKAIHSERFFKIKSDLELFKRKYLVDLLLEKVDHGVNISQISALPFSYFQGFKFGCAWSECEIDDGRVLHI